jgi:hypothetical protein
MAVDTVTNSLFTCIASNSWIKLQGTQAFANADFNFVTLGTTNGVTYGADTNGIIFALKAVSKTPLVISLDRAQGVATDVINRTLEYTSTGNSANEWYAFDLGLGVKASISKYTCAYASSNPTQISRNWKLQGTNTIATWDTTGVNGATWTDIDIRTNDTTILNASPWCGVFTCNQSNANQYRYLRYYNTGNNLGGLGYIQVSEIEFYGHLTF